MAKIVANCVLLVEPNNGCCYRECDVGLIAVMSSLQSLSVIQPSDAMFLDGAFWTLYTYCCYFRHRLDNMHYRILSFSVLCCSLQYLHKPIVIHYSIEYTFRIGYYRREWCLDIAHFSMGSKYKLVSRWRALAVEPILKVIRWNDDHVDDDLGCHRDTLSMECLHPTWSICGIWRSVGWGCRHWFLGPIEDSIAAAVMSITDGMQWSKEG